MPFDLRLTAQQRESLKAHLFSGDGNEAVSVAVCGFRNGPDRTIFCVHQVLHIPYEACAERSPVRVRWDVMAAMPAIEVAVKRGGAVLKIHSHPNGFTAFSTYDDASDKELFAAISRLSDGKVQGLSVVMMPGGALFGRVVSQAGVFTPLRRLMVAGDDIEFFGSESEPTAPGEAEMRTRQAFGDKTVALLRGLTVGVVGCSGTGSWVVEMLGRLGVGKLVLVDPDVIERKNLNRIVNSTEVDAENKTSKVEVMARGIAANGLGTKVRAIQGDLARRDVIEELAACDVLFGCMDSADGRELLNRIATYYIIPYFDVGIRLDADGSGGINQICGAVHYLIPGGSSLLSRGVITSAQVGAEAMRRRNPEQYQALLKEGYIRGIAVDRPAVISVNGFVASHAVNELLARLHPFRSDGNDEFRYQILSLRDGAWLRIPDGEKCGFLNSKTGRGDCTPLLGSPELS